MVPRREKKKSPERSTNRALLHHTCSYGMELRMMAAEVDLMPDAEAEQLLNSEFRGILENFSKLPVIEK